MTKIIIIGGGFAGINLAEKLGNKEGLSVTLVDRNNYNFFPPLLYQVATGYLEASNISYPFRKLLRKMKNISFRQGEFERVIPAENKIVLSTGELQYDCLVFATGAETNYFGMENVKQHAKPMKTINDALELRNHFFQQLEKATLVEDDQARNKLLTVVIAGGGPTGVEVSGMLAEMKKYVIPKDYPELTGHGYESHIYLVDGGTKVLAPMSEKSQEETYKDLTEMGVEIKFNMQVKDYINDTVYFANGETIQTETLVWAAGVTASVFEGIPAKSYGRGRRLLVNEYNQVQDLPNVYAIGDTCLQLTDKNFPEGHPQVAQVAMQQGKNLARNFVAMGKGDPLKPFAYADKGSLAIIGRNKAVADLPKPNIHLGGFIAWVIWVFVHIASLINYRNRLRTMYNWTGAYFTRDQSLRMIIRPSKK
ncbi:MAG: dehydrogenase [Ferruginibacter sp.]|nr:dehydrogenase [Ferruginibacter sp.]